MEGGSIYIERKRGMEEEEVRRCREQVKQGREKRENERRGIGGMRGLASGYCERAWAPLVEWKPSIFSFCHTLSLFPYIN